MKVIFLILLFFSISLFGSVGKITGLKGDVFVNRDGKNIKAVVGFKLMQKDKIITKDRSKALVLFNDKTSITVGKNSTLSVEEFVFDLKEPKKSKAHFGFGKGLFKTISGKIAKINRKEFKLKTKSASIGVRGSVGSTIVYSDGSIKHTTYEGAFILTDLKTGQVVDIPKGKTAKLSLESGLSVAITTKADLKEASDVTVEDKEIKKLEDNKESKTEKQEKKIVKKESKKQNTKITKEQKIKIVDNSKIVDKDKSNITTIEIKEDSIVKDIVVQDIVEEPDIVIQDISSINLDNKDIKEFKEADVTSAIEEVKNENKTVQIVTPTFNKIDLDSITKEIVGSDTYDNVEVIEYGYLKDAKTNEVVSTYLTGSVTPKEIVEVLMQKTQTAKYSGKVAALINSKKSSGVIDLDFNFQTKNLTGKINIEDSWIANINSADLTSSGYKTDDITSSSDSKVKDITGSLSGKFYGPDIQNSGGSFELNSKTDGKVTGTFGAKRVGN